MYVCMYIYAGIFACEYRYPQKPEEDIGSSGASITGDCKPPNMSVGKQSRVLCKKTVLSLNY